MLNGVKIKALFNRTILAFDYKFILRVSRTIIWLMPLETSLQFLQLFPSIIFIYQCNFTIDGIFLSNDCNFEI